MCVDMRLTDLADTDLIGFVCVVSRLGKCMYVDMRRIISRIAVGVGCGRQTGIRRRGPIATTVDAYQRVRLLPGVVHLCGGPR